jgi:hypothetical protein
VSASSLTTGARRFLLTFHLLKSKRGKQGAALQRELLLNTYSKLKNEWGLVRNKYTV